MLTNISSRLIDSLGDWNAQLFRELKARLTNRNIILVSSLSILGQFLLFIYFRALLPNTNNLGKGYHVYNYNSNRYCVGTSPDYSVHNYQSFHYCTKDLLNNLIIRKDLWWLDLFTTMSFIGVVILLILGCYLLVEDLSKESRNNTLNFIRLSPQSAKDIFIGKILGVPILIYVVGLITIPLHLIAGIMAGISFPLIIAFYGILAISCFFFYSASILYSLVTVNLGNFQPLLATVAIFFFLMTTTLILFQTNMSEEFYPFSWLLIFNPLSILVCFVKSTFIPPYSIGYFSYEELSNFSWYSQSVLSNSLVAIAIIMFNYSLWSFWIWQGLNRCFRNPLNTVITKLDSYGITLSFLVMSVGFALQDSSSFYLTTNFQMLQFLNFILFVILMIALSPNRQSLIDWSRYRHYNPKESRSLFYDLILGEKSPPIVAIAINTLIVTLYTLPFILILPLEGEAKIELSMGLVLAVSITLVYISCIQLFLMAKKNKPSFQNVMILCVTLTLIFLPPFLAVMSRIIFNFYPNNLVFFGLFSPLPSSFISNVSFGSIFSIFVMQLVAIATLNLQMTKVLNKVGMSQTKILSQTVV